MYTVAQCVRSELHVDMLSSPLYRVSFLDRPQVIRMVCKNLLIVLVLPMMKACTLIARQPYASRLCSVPRVELGLQALRD